MIFWHVQKTIAAKRELPDAYRDCLQRIQLWIKLHKMFPPNDENRNCAQKVPSYWVKNERDCLFVKVSKICKRDSGKTAKKTSNKSIQSNPDIVAPYLTIE